MRAMVPWNIPGYLNACVNVFMFVYIRVLECEHTGNSCSYKMTFLSDIYLSMYPLVNIQNVGQSSVLHIVLVLLLLYLCCNHNNNNNNNNNNNKLIYSLS